MAHCHVLCQNSRLIFFRVNYAAVLYIRIFPDNDLSAVSAEDELNHTLLFFSSTTFLMILAPSATNAVSSIFLMTASRNDLPCRIFRTQYFDTFISAICYNNIYQRSIPEE